MNPRPDDTPASGGDVPIDDPTVAFYTQHTGPRMTPNMRSIFRELGRYADPETGVSGPSQATIADALDVHRTTVKGGVSELIHLGLLVEMPKQGVGGKQVDLLFTAAAGGWQPKSKTDLVKAPVIVAYRQLVAELRSKLEASEKRNVIIAERVAQLEGSGHTPTELPEGLTPDEPHGGNGEDIAVTGSAAVRAEQDEVNVGPCPDIDPPGQWPTPTAASRDPNPQSNPPTVSDDNRRTEKASDPAQRQRYERVPGELGDRQAGAPLTKDTEQLAFPTEATALSSREGESFKGGVRRPDNTQPLPSDQPGPVSGSTPGGTLMPFIDSGVGPGAKCMYMMRSKGGGTFGDWSRPVNVTSVGGRPEDGVQRDPGRDA